MEQRITASYRFGPFLLEPLERRLTKGDGAPVDLTVKAFDILLLMVSKHNRLVTKDEIIDQVWGEVSVAESNLTTTISMIRKALGETDQQRYIETVPKKGYRFVSDVVELPDTRSSRGESHLPVAVKPVVLPTGTNGKFYLLAGLVFALAIVGIVVFLRLRSGPSRIADDLYRRASELEVQGNDRLAMESLNEALRIKPNFDEANLKAGWIEYQDDEDDTAVKYVQAVIDRNSRLQPGLGTLDQSPHSRCNRLKAEGLRFLLKGDLDNARGKLQLASDSDPTDVPALYYLSDLFIDMGLLDDADRLLSKCRRMDSTNPFCIFQTIETLVYENRFDDATSEYERALRLGVRYPWLEKPAGFAKLGEGDLNGALAHFRALADSGQRLGSNTHFRASQEGIAAIALYQGRLEDARRQIVSALETSGSDYDKASYYISLAQIDALHGRKTEAEEEVQNATRLSQSDELAVVAVETLAVVGDYTSASEILRQHQGAAPSLGKSYVAAGQFVSGSEAVSRHDLKRGVAVLGDAYRFQPEPDIAYYLARAQMQAASWQEATETLNGILNQRGMVLMDSIASLLPLTEYDLGVCYDRLGNRPEAARHFGAVQIMWNEADPSLKGILAHR
jgi:DNA-binding winged helix-turn-helix (wHTH) protein